MKKTALSILFLLFALVTLGNEFENLQIVGNIPEGAFASIVVRNEEKYAKGFSSFDAIIMIQRIYLYKNGVTQIFDGIEIKAGAYSIRLSKEDLEDWILRFDEIIKYIKSTKLSYGYFHIGDYFFLMKEDGIKEIVFDNNVTRTIDPSFNLLSILKSKKQWMDSNP
jgi:hypothetical protein